MLTTTAKQRFKAAYTALRGDGRASYVGTSAMQPYALEAMRNRLAKDETHYIHQRIAYAFVDKEARTC